MEMVSLSRISQSSPVRSAGSEEDAVKIALRKCLDYGHTGNNLDAEEYGD